jgi:NitT/TauT family transport system substrate-binding protein
MTAAPSGAQTKIVIGLPVSTYGPFVPVYAARDLGIFAKNGANVEITAFRGGAVAQEALTAGSVDLIDNAPFNAALAVQKGVNQKIIATSVLTLKGWHIMVLPTSPIKTTKDLVGKNVAVTAAGGLTDFYLKYAAQQAGVAVNAIPVGGASLVPALKGKQVDASTMHAPLPIALMLNNEGRSIYDIEKGVPPNTPDVWVAKQELIDKNPEAIAAVLKSIYQAVNYMKAHREEGLTFFKKYSGESDDKVVAWQQDEMLPTLPTAAKIDKAMLQNSIDLGKIGGLNLPSADVMYSDKFASVTAE